MKNILAKILFFVMLINSIFSTGLLNIFAKPKNSENFSLKWNKESSLTDTFEIVNREEKNEDAFISWDLEKTSTGNVTQGTYTLSYNDNDGQEIKLEIIKNDDKATVNYKIDNDNTVNNNNKLEVYKPEEKVYKEANQTNFPQNDPDFCINGFYNGGLARSVSFKIKKGTGFAFKYKGKNVKFKWDNNGLFYFSTNGISQGYIYDFKLDFINSINQKPPVKPTLTKVISIFTGINKSTFKSKPIANGGKGSKDDPIMQIERPIKEYPGQNPELEISFETPKRFNKDEKKYEYINNTNMPGNIAYKESIKVILDLKTNDSKKEMQIIIDDIYQIQTLARENNKSILDKINKNLDGAEVYDINRSNDGATVSFKIRNKQNGTDAKKEQKITAGTIYNPVTISATSNKKTTDKGYFESLITELPIGLVYTYIEYEIVSLGAKEFYIEFQPFKGYNGFYTVYQGSSILNKWATYEEKRKGEQKVLIPVPLELISDNTSESLFRIDFQFAPSENSPQQNLILSSQVLKYKGNKSDIKLGVPQNLKVIESDIIRETVNGNSQDQLYVTFKWDVGYEDVLKSLHSNNGNKAFDIKYKFYETLKQNSNDEEELCSANFNVNFENNNKPNFSIKKIDSKDEQKNKAEFLNGLVTERTETIGGKATKIIEATAQFKIPVSYKLDTNQLRLIYPNIYFITVEGEYSITNGKPEPNETKTYKTGKSLPATLTLDGLLNIELSPPQNIKIDEKTVTNAEFILSMDKLAYENTSDVLYSYVNRLLKRYNLEIADKGLKYNVYITQDKSLLDEMQKHDSREYNKEKSFPESLKNKIKTLDFNKEISSSNIVDLKTNNSIDELRKGNIIKVTNLIQSNEGIQNIKFSGLDENQVYYIIAETTVDLQTLKNQKEKNKDISKFSKIVTLTTLKDNENPEDSEKIPSAPTNFKAENTTLNSTNILWDTVTEVTEPNKKSKLEYQFIRINGQELPDTFLKSKNSYQKTWEDLKNIQNKVGFKTEEDKIFEYQNNSFTQTSKDKFEYISYNGSRRNILDKTLSPNQIYFYYIRTVRIVDGKDTAYSVWVPLSVTTKNTEPPKNLKIERNAEYDKKTEIVISFDSPKISIDAIGKEYNYQYSIKKDGENWGNDINIPKSEMKIEDNPDGKTMKITYKIKGLSSGSLYTIRVRIFNINLGSASIYSNEAEHRTDSDSNDNDYDQNLNDWNNHFKELIEKLKKEPYWFMENTNDITSVVFRPQYFDVVLNQNLGSSIINLPEGTGIFKEYYIPANIVLKCFEENKGFKITFNGIDIVISPKSINPYENDAIKELQKIKNSQNINDYFIKLTAKFKPIQYIIDGYKNTSPVIEINLDILATKETTLKWDSYALSHIDELLKTKKYSTDIKESIKDMLNDKQDDLFISKQILRYVSQFKDDFGKRILKEIKNITKRTFYSNQANGNIIIAVPNIQGFITKGYKFIINNWQNMSVYDYMGKKAISIKEFGQYTFTSSKLIVNGIENIPNNQAILNIITKYSLDDYLGKNGNLNINANLTREMAIGSIARILGNSKTKNPIEFFKEKGIVLSNRNLNQNISSQEAIYLTMKAYEIKSNKKLESIKIRNYNRLSNLNGINSKYKTAINVAFEIGIYKNENLSPNAPMKIQEFLQMLANLSFKIGI